LVQVGAAKAEIPSDLRDEIQAKWREVVTPLTGFEDYAAFREAASWYRKQARGGGP
jgi:hypothetical protein